MFNEYLDKAMRYAQYEQIEDGTYLGSISGFQGVWANSTNEQACREELREVLEGWVLLNIDPGGEPKKRGEIWLQQSFFPPNGDYP